MISNLKTLLYQEAYDFYENIEELQNELNDDDIKNNIEKIYRIHCNISVILNHIRKELTD